MFYKEFNFLGKTLNGIVENDSITERIFRTPGRWTKLFQHFFVVQKTIKSKK